MAEENIYHTYIVQARYNVKSDSFTVTSKNIEGYTGEIKNLREAVVKTRPGLADMLVLNYYNQGEELPKPTSDELDTLPPKTENVKEAKK